MLAFLAIASVSVGYITRPLIAGPIVGIGFDNALRDRITGLGMPAGQIAIAADDVECLDPRIKLIPALAAIIGSILVAS